MAKPKGEGVQERRARRAEARRGRERAARARARRRTARRMAVTAAVVLSLGGIGFFIFQGASGGVAYAGDLRVGGRLEGLTLPALESEGTVDYAAFSDRPLVINFFASWCPACIAEMPAFQRAHEQLGERVGFLGVSQSDRKAASVELAHETGIRYPAGVDAAGAFFRAVGGAGMPTTIFVRPGGEIAHIQVGQLDETLLLRFVQQYLGVSA